MLVAMAVAVAVAVTMAMSMSMSVSVSVVVMALMHTNPCSSYSVVSAMFGCYLVVVVKAEDLRKSFFSPHAKAMKDVRWYTCTMRLGWRSQGCGITTLKATLIATAGRAF